MTMEYAAQLVDTIRKVNNNEAAELFSHFVDYFDMSEVMIMIFAEMSGYLTVSIHGG